MSRFHSYLNSASKIVQQYEGAIPLAAWLKDYFRQHANMGSKDRKTVSELVYSFYRLGHSMKAGSTEEKLLAGLFLTNQSSHQVLQHLRPEWNEAIGLSLPEKQHMLQQSDPEFDVNNIFPWQQELSNGIDVQSFNRSFLQQPDLFIRIRPGFEKTVIEKLSGAGIAFQPCANNCISMPNATNLTQLLDIGKEAVIQDYHSQQTGHYFFPVALAAPAVWDCCAASGGKSIMAYDLNPSLRLTISDIRTSILHNLAERFQKAGIRHYHSFVADLSDPGVVLPSGDYDLIIADVPCSGSGTWSRTPEQLYFFKPVKIVYYHDLQRKIMTSVIKKLKSDGRLVYITCSVFKQENEDIVAWMKEQLHMKPDDATLLKGYDMRADSMFVAVLKK